MTEPRGTICYFTQEDHGGQIYLCVMDQEAGAAHRYPVNLLNLSRIVYEAAGYMNIELGVFTRPLP